MRIVCFNVQRWGAATKPERRRAFDKRFAELKPDLTVYTELTSKCPGLAPFNPSYRRKNPAQLCYGGKLHTAAGDTNLVFRRLESDEVDHRTAAYESVYGHTRALGRLVNRAPAITNDGPIPVVVFHAPASYKARQAVIMIACWLDEHYREYLFIGDMNVTPALLKAKVKGTGAAFIANQLRYTMSGTHRGARGGSKRYDFVIAKRKDDKMTSIAPMLSGLLYTSSDHCPVVIDTSG